MPLLPTDKEIMLKIKSPVICLNLQSNGEDQHLPCLTQQDSKSILYKEELPEEENM